MQIKQQFYGQSAPLISTDMFEVNRFIMDKLNLPAKLSASDDKMKATLAQAAQQQPQQPPEGAQPSTTAGAVQFPQDRGQTI